MRRSGKPWGNSDAARDEMAHHFAERSVLSAHQRDMAAF
jgi:hypothetical protein